jgi:hypothetical protein
MIASWMITSWLASAASRFISTGPVRPRDDGERVLEVASIFAPQPPATLDVSALHGDAGKN